MADGPGQDRRTDDAVRRGDGGGDRRAFWSSPWLWTALVVVVVGGALVVSVLAGRPPDPAADDLSAFCPAVRAYWEDTPLLTTIDLNGAPPYDRVRADAARLRQTAPSAVAADVDTVADGLEQLADQLAALNARQQAQPGSVSVDEVSRTIDRAGRGRERASERLATYIEKGCGIDLAAPPPTSTPTAGTPLGPVPPSSAPTAGTPLGLTPTSTAAPPAPGPAGGTAVPGPAAGR